MTISTTSILTIWKWIGLHLSGPKYSTQQVTTFCFFRLASSNCGVMMHKGCLHHSTVVMCIVIHPMIQIGMTYVTKRIQMLYLKYKRKNTYCFVSVMSKCVTQFWLPFMLIRIPSRSLHYSRCILWKKKCSSFDYKSKCILSEIRKSNLFLILLESLSKDVIGCIKTKVAKQGYVFWMNLLLLIHH